MDSLSGSFERDRHVRYLEMMFDTIPSPYQDQEVNRLTLAYFVISGLDILDALDRVDKDQVARWVLSLQVNPQNPSDLDDGQFYGFQSISASQFPADKSRVFNHNNSHLASTYSALAILKTVGYSLSTIDHKSILMSMKNLQQPDGSFMPIHIEAETDLRFVYCAAAICHMLNDWSGMDKDKAKEYILACQSYDGGFGLIPGSESHGFFLSPRFQYEEGFLYSDNIRSGMTKVIERLAPDVTFAIEATREVAQFRGKIGRFGDLTAQTMVGIMNLGGATYCGVAALRLMGIIEDNLVSKHSSSSAIDLPLLLEWCLQRQTADGGFQGRCNKASDTCYAFWVGGILRILGAQNFIDKDALRGFLLTCQSKYGGFSKYPMQLPDLYHSYFGFSAFSMLGEPGLKHLCVELGITSLSL